MFGILDRLYVRSKSKAVQEGIDLTPQVISNDISDQCWYCFVPRVVMRNKRIRAGTLPPNGKIVVYTVSYIDMLVPDAEQTRDNLRRVYLDAMSKINQDLGAGKIINVLGVSIGNVLSIRCASNLPDRRVNCLVSLIGGGRLGSSAWNSIATRDVALKSGCETVEEYEGILNEFAPVNNLIGLHANRVFARFGSSDLMIKYRPNGLELKHAFEVMDAGYRDIRTYLWADHGSALLRASREGIYDKLK